MNTKGTVRQAAGAQFAAVLAGLIVVACSSSPSLAPGGTGTPGPTIAATPQPTITPAPPVGTWTTTGGLRTARFEHTATLLHDGTVLVAGGAADPDEKVELASAELFDPETGQWTPTGSMVTPRARHTATLLVDGRVLVAGGYCDGRTTEGCPTVEDPDGAISEAEIYDPKTGTWTTTGSMTTMRFLQTATLLAEGKVLVAGAEHAPDSILDSAELYDPTTGTWTATGRMSQARTQQLAAILPDGKVLVAGGVGPVSPTEHDLLSSAELYDPSGGTWAATGSLITARAFGGTASSLPDGKVIVIGGDGPGDPVLGSAEIYDPDTGTWSATGSLAAARDLLTSTVLRDGTVLVAGGFEGSDAVGFTSVAPTELYDPRTGTWAWAGDLPEPRVFTTATLLAADRVLIVGGSTNDGTLSSCVLYSPDLSR